MLNLQSQDEGEQSFQFRLSTHLQAKTDSWFQLWFQMAFRSESCLSSACQNSKVPPLQVIIRHDAPWWQLKWLSLLQKEMLQVFSKLQLSPFGKFPQKFTICAFFAHGEPCGLSPGIMSDLRITMQRRRLQSHSAAFWDQVEIRMWTQSFREISRKNDRCCQNWSKMWYKNVNDCQCIKPQDFFFLFFTRQTSKRALLLPCHASRGELKSSKKPKRPAPKAVARLKPGIERCSPDAWRSMAKHGDAWKQRNETKETSRSFEHPGNASRVCRVCGMMSDVIVLICIIFDFSQTFLQGPPAVLTSGHGVSAASHNLPHCAGVVSLRLTLHERRFMDTFQTWPGVWAKGHRDVRCTEPMRGRHQKWIEMDWNGAEMDWNGAFGHDGWGRTFQDSIAPTTTGPWGPRKITNRCTDTQRALEITWTNTTNFMFGKKICVMHFFYVGYRSLLEL